VSVLIIRVAIPNDAPVPLCQSKLLASGSGDYLQKHNKRQIRITLFNSALNKGPALHQKHLLGSK
jgi:hypothetical protein